MIPCLFQCNFLAKLFDPLKTVSYGAANGSEHKAANKFDIPAPRQTQSIHSAQSWPECDNIYCTTLVAAPEYWLSTPDVLNAVATNS